MTEPSDFMRRWIEEDQDVERLRTEGKLPPPDPHLQAKMDISGGAAEPGEKIPWERIKHQSGEEDESELGGEDA